MDDPSLALCATRSQGPGVKVEPDGHESVVVVDTH